MGAGGPPSGAGAAPGAYAGYPPPSPHQQSPHRQQQPGGYQQPPQQQPQQPYGSYGQLPQSSTAQSGYGQPAAYGPGGAGYGMPAQQQQQAFAPGPPQQQQPQQQQYQYGPASGHTQFQMPYQPGPGSQVGLRLARFGFVSVASVGAERDGCLRYCTASIPSVSEHQQHIHPLTLHNLFQTTANQGMMAPLGGSADPAAGFMSGLSPLGLMAAGGLLSAPQQYMQQRMGWLKTNMTGGTMSALFNITSSYGARGGIYVDG